MLFPKQGKPSGAMELLSTAGTIGLQLVCATFIGLAMTRSSPRFALMDASGRSGAPTPPAADR